MVAARDGVYFVRTHGGPQTIHRIGPDGRTAALPMPFESGVYELSANSGMDGIDARLSGWVQPFGIWRYLPDRGKFVSSPLNPQFGINLDRFTSFQMMATARDGTRVPVSIVSRRGLARDGSAPCLVRCYSAYGISASPQFNPRILPLLEQGGVFAQVHARGGGEFGSRWWRAGQKESKANSWRDLIDGCLALFRERITSPSRVSIMGGSAGGVAVGRALTERPELFAGAILNVAFTNTTRIDAEPSGESQFDEFGDPRIEAEFRALYAMDSYQHVRDGKSYPAMLIMHGMTDSRVAPWQSAKLAARLQKANAGKNPVLLRVTFDSGHGPGSTRVQADEQWADMIAFTLNSSAPGQR
jgi:prolyl oligopeptidase